MGVRFVNEEWIVHKEHKEHKERGFEVEKRRGRKMGALSCYSSQRAQRLEKCASAKVGVRFVNEEWIVHKEHKEHKEKSFLGRKMEG